MWFSSETVSHLRFYYHCVSVQLLLDTLHKTWTEDELLALCATQGFGLCPFDFKLHSVCSKAEVNGNKKATYNAVQTMYNVHMQTGFYDLFVALFTKKTRLPKVHLALSQTL